MTSPQRLQKLLAGTALVIGAALLLVGLAAPQGDATAAPATMARHPATGSCPSTPTAGHLTISSRCVDAPLVAVGITHNAVDIPANVHVVGWYQNTPSPNASAGSTVIVGHVNYYTQGAGAFYQLWFVKPGAIVKINYQGHLHSWKVVSTQYIDKGHLPWSLFASSGKRYLTLITCGGILQHSAAGWHYNDNVVVRAVPVS